MRGYSILVGYPEGGCPMRGLGKPSHSQLPDIRLFNVRLADVSLSYWQDMLWQDTDVTFL